MLKDLQGSWTKLIQIFVNIAAYYLGWQCRIKHQKVTFFNLFLLIFIFDILVKLTKFVIKAFYRFL